VKWFVGGRSAIYGSDAIGGVDPDIYPVAARAEPGLAATAFRQALAAMVA